MRFDALPVHLQDQVMAAHPAGKGQKAGSEYEEQLVFQLMAAGLSEPQRQFQFNPFRRWRFDLCWPERMIAVEVDGATWAQGRHTRGAGFEKDCEKLNSAVEMGWAVYRFTADMVKDGRAFALLERVLSR